MKSNLIPHKLRGTLQNTTSPSYRYSKTSQGYASEYFIGKNIDKNEPWGTRATALNNFSVSTNNSNPKNKPTNQISILAAAMSCCLNNQSIMTNAIADISQYLLELKEEAGSVSAYSRRQLDMPHTVNTNSVSSLASSKIKANTTNKCPLQQVLNKLEDLKKEIGIKISEFEGYLSMPDTSDLIQSKVLALPTDEFPNDTPQKLLSSTQKTANITANKHPYGLLASKNSNIQQIPPSQRVNTLSSDFDRSHTETFEATHVIKSFLETMNSEYKSSAQRDSAQPKATEKNDTFSPPNHKKASYIIQGNSDTYTTQVLSNSGITKQDVPSKAERAVNTKTIGPTGKLSELSFFKPEKRVTIQPSHQKNSNTLFYNTPVSNERDEKHSMKSNNSARHRITSSCVPKELNSNLGRKENSIKPAQLVIPQKQIMDDSFGDNNVDVSILETDNFEIIEDDFSKTVDFLPYGKNTRREKMHFATEGDEYLNSDIQEFIKNTANKEKSIIKNLMKQQVRGDESPKNKEQDTNHLKKCLINAKWWREWNDFVNFNAEEDLKAKCIINLQLIGASFCEMALYPRPGPINNKDLLSPGADLGHPISELELKENLLEHHDYEAISKSVYDVLAKWYGSDFEICRALRPDPFHGNKPYLELYPKRRLAGKTNPKSFDASIEGAQSELFNNIKNTTLYNF